MKKVMQELTDMVMITVAGVLTAIGSVFAFPGRILSWIGNGLTSIGGRIAVYVSRRHG